MAVELAEVAAGLPVAASLALAGGLTSFRAGRRRASLNEAMHELRRPLQILSLALPSDSPEAAPIESSLQLATGALERLDREINGISLEEVVNAVSVGEIVDDAARRWRKAPALRGRGLEVRRNRGAAVVEGDRFGLAQALDNLLNNAIEHGAGTVRIEWHCEDGWVSISISDAGGPTNAKRKRHALRRGRSRKGHGLRVVDRIARRHGGSFGLQRGAEGTEATLRLPLCGREPTR